MKVQIDIDEQKILELAKTESIDNLPRAIYYEAKRQATEQAVNEIKSKLVEKPYYGDKERLYSEVSNALYKNIERQIKEFVEQKFNEKAIQSIIDRHFDRVFTEWIEKRIYERLEAVKKDIFIGSSGEIEAELEAQEDAHRAEVEAMEERF